MKSALLLKSLLFRVVLISFFCLPMIEQPVNAGHGKLHGKLSGICSAVKGKLARKMERKRSMVRGLKGRRGSCH